MRRDKDLAFKLRESGKSYKEIQEELDISKSTLSNWFSSVSILAEIRNKNSKDNIKLSRDRIIKLNEGRSRILEEKYKNIEIEAEREFHVFKNDPLFSAGLMIYAGEGDKRSRNITRISNSEFYMHKIFIDFSLKYLDISRDYIKLGLILYDDNNETLCINRWSEILGININNFHKTQIIKGKEKVKRLQYGTGISIISARVVTKKKILKWLEMVSVFGF